MTRLCFFTFGAFFSLAVFDATSNAQEWDVLVQKSIGRDAIDYNPAGLFSSYADTILIDGKVTSFPTRAVTYDRTFVNYADFMGVIPVGPKIGLRLDLMTKFAMRNEEGSEEPRSVTHESWAEAFPKAEAVFITQSGLEVFAGGTYWIHSRVEERTETSTVDTVTAYSDAAVLIPHVGIVKRTGVVDGGFYYKAHGEKTRNVTKVTSVDSTELKFTDVLYDPTVIAFFFQTTMATTKLFGEFAAVQASDGGDRSDTGELIMDDYMRAKLSFFTPLSGDFGLRLSAAHKTLSYANNRNVTLATIPMTSLTTQFVRGTEKSYSYIGFIYAYGKDGQSLPEFNAEYKVQSYGLTAGLRLAF